MIINDERELYMETDRSYYYTVMGMTVISRYAKVENTYKDQDEEKKLEEENRMI